MASSLNLERIYDEHAPALFAFLLNLTRNEADTRDLLQEVFVKIAGRPDLLEGVRDLRAFLIRMSHNAAIDFMRRNATRDRSKKQFGTHEEAIFAPATGPDEESFLRPLARA